MSGNWLAVTLLGVGAVLSAIATAVITSMFRRAERTGERIGRLEKWMDHERGRQVGLRESRRKRLSGNERR